MVRRREASARAGKRGFFRPVAVAAMLAVSTIMLTKRAYAEEPKKPKVEKTEKEKPGPKLTAKFFGGVYNKGNDPFVGLGLAASSPLGPTHLDTSVELAATSFDNVALEKAELMLTIPIAKIKKWDLPISVTPYVFSWRMQLVDIGAGAAFNAGNLSAGAEWNREGNAVPLYAFYNVNVKSLNTTITPQVIYVPNYDLLGGQLAVSVRPVERMSFYSTFFFISAPADKEVVAANVAGGVAFDFK